MNRWRYWKWCGGLAAVALCGAVWFVWPEQREPDRKFLWDAESIGLELGRTAWPQLSDAIREADAHAISAVFAEGFQAEVSRQPKQIEVEREFGRFPRSEATGNEWKQLDASAFTNWLLELRDQFQAKPHEVKFSLKAISPAERDKPAGDWQGTVAVEIRGAEKSGSRRELVILLDFRSVCPKRKMLADGGWLPEISTTTVESTCSFRTCTRKPETASSTICRAATMTMKLCVNYGGWLLEVNCT